MMQERRENYHEKEKELKVIMGTGECSCVV